MTSIFHSMAGIEGLSEALPSLAISARPPTISVENMKSPGRCVPNTVLEQSREFKLLQKIAPPGQVLKASVPGPYTLSGRINPGGIYKEPLGRNRGLDSNCARGTRCSWWSAAATRSRWMSPR